MRARLERALATQEIRDVLARYARGVDRADGPLLKSCYHPDAIEEHGGNYTGNAFEYVDCAVPRIRGMGAMQHLLGTSHIEFDGDTAWVETYLWTFARFAADGRSTDTFTGGRLDRPLRAPRRRMEDRASPHGVRLESRHAEPRRLVHGPVRSRETGHAPRPQGCLAIFRTTGPEPAAGHERKQASLSHDVLSVRRRCASSGAPTAR